MDFIFFLSRRNPEQPSGDWLHILFQIAACTHPKIRGLLGSLPAVFMAFGISYVYLMGAFMPWHILAYVCTIVPLLTFIGVIFSPESPVWLVANGKLNEADRASNWLNGIEEPAPR